MRFGRVPSAGAIVPVELECIVLWCIHMIVNQEAPQPHGPECLPGCHSVGMDVSVTGRVIELSLQPALSLEAGQLKVPALESPGGSSSGDQPHPEAPSLLSRSCLISITKTPPTLKKLQGILKLCARTRSIFYYTTAVLGRAPGTQGRLCIPSCW